MLLLLAGLLAFGGLVIFLEWDCKLEERPFTDFCERVGGAVICSTLRLADALGRGLLAVYLFLDPFAKEQLRDVAGFSRRVDAMGWGGARVPQPTSEWLERFKAMSLDEMHEQIAILEDEEE